MSENYRFVYKGGTGEITEKKSRFIASVAPAATEAEASSFIEKTRKKYWDAKHNCTAFTIGERHGLTRSSDDGEPPGTAGHPMLDVLLGEDVHDTVVVVTRYFGGILLGTGGLVRAYSAAVREGLKNSVLLEKQTGIQLAVSIGYGDYGKIQYLTSENHIPVLESSFSDTVSLKLMVPAAEYERFALAVTEATCGKAVLLKGPASDFALNGTEILML